MPDDVTQILIKVSEGDSDKAYSQLFDKVYDQLKDIAMRQMKYERAGHTFAQTDLVHEVFFDMVDKDQIDWKNRSHFYGLAAICMK